MRTLAAGVCLVFALATVACSQDGTPALKVELRDFAIKEDRNAATSYSKEWNQFAITGSLLLPADSPYRDQNIAVMLEVKDRCSTLGNGADEVTCDREKRARQDQLPRREIRRVNAIPKARVDDARLVAARQR